MSRRCRAELNRAARLTSLGTKPPFVLSAGTRSLAGWAAQQNDLATLSTDSVHRTIPGATHASLINDHVDAARSSRAVRDVVKAVQGPAGEGRPRLRARNRRPAER